MPDDLRADADSPIARRRHGHMADSLREVRANGKFAKSVSLQAPYDDAGLDVVSMLRFFLTNYMSKGVVWPPPFDI